MNCPYMGGTHLNDVSFIRPIFAAGELIAFPQNKGHWADVGGNVPGSFDVNATTHFSEGLRITPLRVWRGGELITDVAKLMVANTRSPQISLDDLHAQAEATGVCEREVHRLVDKYGKDDVVEAMQEVQDYVERIVRTRVAELPGTARGAPPTTSISTRRTGKASSRSRSQLTIEGDQVSYDLSGSAPAVATFLNAGYGTAFSGIVAGTKTFFPDVPLNSGFYNAIAVDIGPKGTVVNTGWPHAVTGFCSGPYEKVMNAGFELWSQVIPERAMACSYNLE